MFFFLLMVAGNDSTRAVFTSGIKNLLDDPEQMELVRSGAVPLEQVVEEFVRYNPAFAYMRRTATRDTEVAGQAVKAGDKLALWYVSGNRDETVFDDPAPLRRSPRPEPPPGLRRRRAPLLPRRRARAPRAEALDRGDARALPATSSSTATASASARRSSTSTCTSPSRSTGEPLGPGGFHLSSGAVGARGNSRAVCRRNISTPTTARAASATITSTCPRLLIPGMNDSQSRNSAATTP